MAVKFQSTPPRGRRRARVVLSGVAPVVSIHASAREATNNPSTYARPVNVSIHASAREATIS